LALDFSANFSVKEAQEHYKLVLAIRWVT